MRSAISKATLVGGIALATVVALAIPVGAAITAPAANATVSGTVTLSDNGAQSAGCSDLDGISTSDGSTDMYVDQTTGTSQTTLVTPPAADSGTSTVVNLGKVSSLNSTTPESGTWETDLTGNGTYTVNSAEQAAKSTLGIICGSGTLTSAKETVTVSNSGELTSGTNPTGYPGQSITVKATLTDQNGVAPVAGQTVTFALSGGNTVNVATVTGGVAQTTMVVAGLPRTATLTTSYAGTYFTSASITQSFAVTPIPTQTVLSTPVTTDYGQTATVTATVTPTATPPSGYPAESTSVNTVQFTVNGVNFGSPEALNASDQAVFSDAALPAGNSTIGAIYNHAGTDANYATSTATSVTQVVNLAPTSISVSSSLSPPPPPPFVASYWGQSITYSATVTATSPGPDTGCPVGTVTFAEVPLTGHGSAGSIGGSETLGACSGASASASSVPIALLPAGTYTVTATFNPATNYGTSTISAEQTVNPAGTSVMLTSTVPTVSYFGESVQFTSVINTTAPGQGSPSGSVDFVIDPSSASPINLGSATTSNDGADAASATSAAISDLSPGLHTIQATYTNTDGNYVSGTSATISQFVAPDPSTIVVSTVDNANPSVWGQPVAFQAAVTLEYTDAGTPQGVVLFFDNGSDPVDCSTFASGYLDTYSLVDGVATTPVDASLPVGANTISACFASTSDAAAYGGSSTQDPQYVQTVNPDPTTTTLTSANSPGGESGPSVWGQPVTFTATVVANAPGAGTPSGTIAFSDGSSPLATVTLSGGTSDDSASFETAALSVGNHAITAVFTPSGTYGADFLTSSDGINQTVNQAQSSTAVVQNGASVQGQPVSFTATVTAVAPGAGTPTGTVLFEVNGANILGNPVPLTPGNPTIGSSATSPTISSLTPGTYDVTAIYSGDIDFLPSNESLNQIVNPASTSTGLVVSPSPDTVGTPVTLTATITPTGSGAGLPTGTVDFYDGTTLLGAVAVSTVGGVQQASLSGLALAVGTHQLSAVYLGEYDFAGSTSSTVSEVVNVIGTTTTLKSSLNPSTYGLSVTFTATVTPANNTGPGPSGTVTFSDGGSPIGTAPVTASGSSFIATLSVSNLPGGANSITASYPGATDYGSSAASALTETVNKATTSITAQQATTGGVLTATLTSTDGAVGPIAGQTISFSTGSTFLCTAVTVANGTASCTAPSSDDLTVGLEGYTATYAGNGNYDSSSANGAASL